jgi:hypothetical protein
VLGHPVGIERAEPLLAEILSGDPADVRVGHREPPVEDLAPVFRRVDETRLPRGPGRPDSARASRSGSSPAASRVAYSAVRDMSRAGVWTVDADVGMIGGLAYARTPPAATGSLSGAASGGAPTFGSTPIWWNQSTESYQLWFSTIRPSASKRKSITASDR